MPSCVQTSTGCLMSSSGARWTTRSCASLLSVVRGRLTESDRKSLANVTALSRRLKGDRLLVLWPIDRCRTSV